MPLAEMMAVVNLLDVRDAGRSEQIGVAFQKALRFLIEILQIGLKHLGRPNRHRAINEHGDVRNPTGAFQLSQEVNDGLGSADGESWNDDLATPGCGPRHDLAETLDGLADDFVGMSAIGTLTEDEIGGGNWSGVS
jgi:hypothetical protein